MDNSGSMNEVIYHASYDPETTYADGTYNKGYIEMFKDTAYGTIDFTVNEKTAKLYWGPGDDGSGVRYDGNYLNWIFWHATEDERNNLPQRTRIQVARQVLTDIVNNTTGVRFGLMKFNSEHGGTVVADCGDLKDTKDTLLNAISEMLATTATPVSETMVEAWYYFTGGDIGDNGNPNKKSFYNNVSYQTPIKYYCQKNFIILITDGKPFGDWTFPDWVLPAINGRYDVTPQSGNSNNPYYLDGVAWYLYNNDANSGFDGLQNVWTYPIGFNIDHPLLKRTAYNRKGLYLTAGNADQLSAALEGVIADIQSNTAFEFTAPTVLAVRIEDETDNVVYLTTFKPSIEPFWEGNLKAYRLNADGTLPVDENGDPAPSSLIWNAHEKLKNISTDSRKIYTYLGGVDKQEFKGTNSNLTKEVLAVGAADRDKLINHIRGIDAYDINKNGKTDEKRSAEENIWILGDIFHSNTVIVGEPSRFFQDECFNWCSDGSKSFYAANKNREKIVLVGANDGMLHAFNAKTGDEEWAFIPESLLKNLKSMLSAHTYYVDSSPKVADVWFYSGSNLSGKTKTKDEWRTVLVCGLRKGGKHYFALDITNTLSPKYLWEFPSPNKNYDYDDIVSKLGQSWSDPAIGRVKVEVSGELYERWVAFIGGGFDANDDATGRAFFVVDIETGNVIWKFTSSDSSDMDHAIPSPPTAVDTNSDGYVDRVYVGDLGGQMWVFNVSFDGAQKKSNSQWSGRILFKSLKEKQEKHKIYYPPAVSFDSHRIPWVFFGTGDREDPTGSAWKEDRFYAVKDDGGGPYEEGSLEERSSVDLNTFSPIHPTKKGWFFIFPKKSGEKVLAKPAVFNKLVYFTTYTYTSTDVCKATGEATLYTVEYLSGGGALVLDDYLQGKPSARSQAIGTGSEGVPSTPVISVNLKGKATMTIGTTSGKIFSKGVHSPVTNKEILYWREVIP